jgi:hypothetical protein
MAGRVGEGWQHSRHYSYMRDQDGAASTIWAFISLHGALRDEGIDLLRERSGGGPLILAVDHMRLLSTAIAD